MRLARRFLLLAALLAPVLAPAVARADNAAADPLGFQFDASQYTAHEAAGRAVVTVIRSQAESQMPAQVRYVTSGEGYDPSTGGPFPCGGTPCTAVSAIDFTSVKGELDFGAGQTSAQFTVPVADEGVDSVPKTIQLALFGPSPIGLGPTSHAVLEVLYDDPIAAASAEDPLGIPGDSTFTDPLAGARLFVDRQNEVANAAHRYHALQLIADQPLAERFGKFSMGSPYVPDIGTAAARYLARAAAQEPGTVPLLSTYAIVHGARGDGDSPAFQAWYHSFIEGLAQGIGSYRAVLFLEMDSIITTPGLNAHGLAVRMAELNDAINILTANCPHLVIYLDAGAADALPAARAARTLEAAGVAKIQGFFVNSTHFDWTSKEIRYGEKISRLTGGKHFVVNTAANGRGPLRPHNIVKEGNEVLCNPAGRGLGPKPTTATGYPNVDMFAWIGIPGASGGPCHDKPGEVQGAPPTGAYWPQYAMMLVRDADFRVR